MGKKRRTFSAHFKKRVLKLHLKGGISLAKISKKLDIHPTVLSSWKSQFMGDPVEAFRGRGNLRSDAVEQRKLQKELKELVTQCRILYRIKTGD